MPQDYSIQYGVRRKYSNILLAAVAPVLLLVGTAARADDNKERKAEPAVRLLTTVEIPVSKINTTAGGMYSFDISWVDQKTGVYYLADRSNFAIDTIAPPSIVTQIVPNNGHAAFAGFTACSPKPAGANDCAGPNGVVSSGRWLFVTDAPSRVLSFDLSFNPPQTVSEVKTKADEPTRADELAYDPRDGLLLVINNAASPPFATLIKVSSTGTLSVVKNIFLDSKPGNALVAFGVDATNGAEQPVWDPATGKFYLSIPEINPPGQTAKNHGAVLRISTAGVVEALYQVDYCSPAGLALGPKSDLLVGCNTIFDTAGNKWTTNADTDTHSAAPQLVILDAKTGKITAHVEGAGVGDEVWFNKGDNHYYAAASGSNLAPNAITPARIGVPPAAPPLTAQGAATLDVIDALSETLDQRVPTLNVPAVTTGPTTALHPAGTAHSVAVDSQTNHVFVPIAANNAFPNCLNGCVAIYGRRDLDTD